MVRSVVRYTGINSWKLPFISMTSLILVACDHEASAVSDGRQSKLTSPDIQSRIVAETHSRVELTLRAASDADAIVVGNPKGDVTLVEFFDYNCDYCRDVAKSVREVVQTDTNLRLVLRSFPLNGTPSVEAASVTWAVQELAGTMRAFEFHTKLMESRKLLNATEALSIAGQMGLDVARLRPLANGEGVRRATDENLRLAQQLELTGTPAFVVGSQVVLGAISRDRIRTTVQNVRTCGATRC